MQWLEGGMVESPGTLSAWIWNLSFPRHHVLSGFREAVSGPVQYPPHETPSTDED
jgi:hypothetical protein